MCWQQRRVGKEGRLGGCTSLAAAPTTGANGTRVLGGGLLSGARMSKSWISQSSRQGRRSGPREQLRPCAGPCGNVDREGGRQIRVLEVGGPAETWTPAGKSSRLRRVSRLEKEH